MSAPFPPTAYDIGLSLLRDLGVTSLDPNNPSTQPFPIEPTDLTDVCQIISSALEEAAQEAGDEHLRQSSGAFIQAPANITLGVFGGSATITGVTTWASWMAGCTIRISGDSDTDNEILSQTLLARPYGGTTGTATATVYCDAITLDVGIDRITGPGILPQNRIVCELLNREQFISQILRPNVNTFDGMCPLPVNGWYAYAPFWSIGPKQTAAYPSAYFMDTYYDPTQPYVLKRVRLTPMPTCAQSIGWTAKMVPPRVTPADMVSGYNTLTVTGAGDGNANQSYVNFTNIAGYNAFAGGTHSAYTIYFHPLLGTYVLCSTPTLSTPPAAYWTAAGAPTVPIGTFNPVGASGVVTIVTTDNPGKIITAPNGWIENLLMPIARQQLTRLPIFKNKEIAPEILRQYGLALRRLRSVGPSPGKSKTNYV